MELILFFLLEYIKTCSPRSVISTELTQIYINDLSMRINSISETIIFGADMNVIICSKNFDDLCRVSNIIILIRVNWILLRS
jgi:hypothetical protein